MAGEFEKITIDGQITWKCNQCGSSIVAKKKPRGHRCFVNPNLGNNMTTPHASTQPPIRPFASAPGGLSQRNASTTPAVSQPSVARINSTPRAPRQRVQSQNELQDFIKLFEAQNLQTQHQLEQQRQKDERFMEMMMQNQQMLINRQEKHEEMLMQTIDSLKKDAEVQGNNSCSKTKRTKCH